MFETLVSVVYAQNLRLAGLSALICALGCFTMTTLMARADEVAPEQARFWLASAATLFGCSVWSLHFVAMLAFLPAQAMVHHVGLAALAILVAVAGVFAALWIRHRSNPHPEPVALGGVLLGFGLAGMHHVGLAATASPSLSFDHADVAASVLAGVAFSAVALARAADLTRLVRRVEVAFWFALAVCGLHVAGLAAATVAPDAATAVAGSVRGTATLAASVAVASGVVLAASLAAVLVEGHLSRRAGRDLVRMRRMSDLATEVLLIHRDGLLLEINSAGERLFGAPAGHLVGRAVLDLFASDSAPALVRRAGHAPAERWPEEVHIRAVGGVCRPVEVSYQVIDYLGRPATVIALRDLTDRKRDETRIRHLARHDALTDLLNRHALQERLDAALDEAARQGAALALLYIDLDRFKPVNDLHGHAVGDALLVQTSKRILAEIGPTDTLARIGGDEFVLLLADHPQPEQVSLTATRVIEALRRPFQVEGHRVEIGASVGAAIFPHDGASADALMRAADAAMYRAKGEGRGALRFYEAAMDARLQTRLQLEHQLTGAVQRDELFLHYQPIVDGVTGEVESFEALVRWRHPARGTVPPVEFIPLAEAAGLIDLIGRWVIDTACREAARWPSPWRVSVNVSPRQFHQSDVCETIGAALLAHALSPGRFVVEVTEGILIDDAAKAVSTLNRLRGMGVRVALDDFGTGFSSLSYLQLFKFDSFKIDKSFVSRLGQCDQALTLTRTIVDLGHNLGLQVTAEGVETPLQLDILQAIGCDHIQGYLVGRPAPADDFTDLDRRRTAALFGRGGLRRSA